MWLKPCLSPPRLRSAVLNTVGLEVMWNLIGFHVRGVEDLHSISQCCCASCQGGGAQHCVCADCSCIISLSCFANILAYYLVLLFIIGWFYRSKCLFYKEKCAVLKQRLTTFSSCFNILFNLLILCENYVMFTLHHLWVKDTELVLFSVYWNSIWSLIWNTPPH